MSFLSKWKKSPLWDIFVGEKSRNVYFFYVTLIPNFIAALLEGLSFGFLLLALSIFNGEKRIEEIIPFLKKIPLILSFSPKEIFVGLVLLAIVSQIIRSSVSYLSQYLTVILSLRIQETALKRVYKQILRLSFPCVSHYKVGDLTKYAETPLNCIAPLMDFANRSIVHFLTLMVCFVFMLVLHVKLTLICLVFFGGIVFFQKVLIKKIAMISVGLAKQTAEFTKRTVQNLHGIRQIHLFSRHPTILQKMEETIHAVSQSRQKLILWNGLVPSVNEVFSILGLGAVLLLGCFILDTRNYLPIFLTYLTVAYRLTVRVREFLTSLGNTAAYCGDVGRLHEILQDEGKEFCHSHGESFSGFSSEIVFENVSLRYGSIQDAFAIHNVSFTIPKNATVALVGSSGAGKSSLVDLLLRLYEPTSGKIVVDGRDVKDYDVKTWREKFGVVSQDLFIFNETIEENIRFGRLDATEAEIIEAAKLSHVHDFVQRLPAGYQTVVGEKGYRLSGGERQRISLARALVRMPEILVLDEATSHLDSQSEKIIQEALSTFRKSKSMIIVAHRLSTISQADIIVVFDRGQIIEMGSHEELMQKKGKYASFWEHQTHKSVHEVVSSLM